MKRHELKIYYKYYEEILKDRKRFEVRRNDRCFKVGDECLLRPYDPDDGFLPLTPILIKIDYLLTLSEVFNIDSDVVVFSFHKL